MSDGYYLKIGGTEVLDEQLIADLSPVDPESSKKANTIHAERLKEILELAKEVVEAEKETDPEEERDGAKEALTELFTEAKTSNTHIIVERIVAEIDDIVKKVRFPDWQHTTPGRTAGAEGTSPGAAEVQAADQPGPVRRRRRLHQAVLLTIRPISSSSAPPSPRSPAAWSA